nr:ribonuclease P protein component [uncultured Holophaga sp.]
MAGRYRVVRHRDHAVPQDLPRPVSGKGQLLDIRVWSFPAELPLLLVSASRKQGRAVRRNQFRRRVRMAFLKVLRECPGLALPGVVWVRPSRAVPRDRLPQFHEIEGQLRLALSRWKKP